MAVLRTYSATTAALSPLAQWRFDEAGGPTLVDSADGLDGVYQGAVSFGQSGAVGADGAVRFGGGGSFALIQSASGGDLTVELAAFGDSLVAGFRVAAPTPSRSASRRRSMRAGSRPRSPTSASAGGRPERRSMRCRA
jgi:hypothetical protein